MSWKPILIATISLFVDLILSSFDFFEAGDGRYYSDQKLQSNASTSSNNTTGNNTAPGAANSLVSCCKPLNEKK